MSEDDIFDEDLVRELGLEPEDLQGPDPVKKKRPMRPAAPKNEVPPPKPAPQAIEKKESVQMPAKPAVPKQTPVDDISDEEFAINATKDIPVQVVAVMGKKSVSLKEILDLKMGEVVNFQKVPQDPIDLVANGKLIAKAELVMVDGKIGARILKLVK